MFYIYTNSGVLIENYDLDVLKKKFNILKWVGYQRIFIDMVFKKNKDFDQILKKIEDITDLPVYGRIIFKPSSLKDLKNNLNYANKLKKFILTLESIDKDILSFAAKDSRIDVISLRTSQLLSNISDGILSLIRQNNKYIDISLYHTFSLNNFERSKYFREFSKIIHFLRKHPLIGLYSGIEDSYYYIRGPRAIISILNSIFELPLIKSKYLLRENPQTLLEKIEERTDRNFIMDGVRIID
ncbi:MAG: RNase P subunit p30 family protein [Promethearchaeota archaeon]